PRAKRARPPNCCPASTRPLTRRSNPAWCTVPPPTARNPVCPSRSTASTLRSSPATEDGPRKPFRLPQTHFRQPERERRAQAPEAVFQAPAEIDRRGLREILRGAAHLANREPVPENLCEHLVVEHKVVGVFGQWQRLQDFP